MKTIKLCASAIAAILLARGGAASAQPDTQVSDIEVPVVVIEQDDADAGSRDEALDLANIVQSAAKGVTTVQEAPVIVTVITADEIRDRQYHSLMEVVDNQPGWSFGNFYNGSLPTALARGQPQAILFLHDGLSLFEPEVNQSPINETQPLELIKRIEMITGPGGVLWGSNSLLGIVNMITKDAEDIDGVEVGGKIGTGSGDRSYARAYAMFGAPKLADGKLKLFAHAAFMTYQGQEMELPLLLFHNSTPQPNSVNIYGPLTKTDQAQTMLLTLDGKLSYDKLQLRVYAPFGQKYVPAGFSGAPSRATLPQDSQCTAQNNCVDPNDLSRKNRVDVFDRYAVLEYRNRLLEQKAGITARAYGQQFIRGLAPLQVLTPSDNLPGGVQSFVNQSSYRIGAGLDGDVELAGGFRVLYGAEVFREWAPNDVTNSNGGEGIQSNLIVNNFGQVPVPCPRIYDPNTMTLAFVPRCPLTFMYPSSRTVLGAYLNPQYRPTKELSLEVGGRLQVAPAALGLLPYDLNTTVAATVVWSFIPNWHLKLNYAQGFRSPVFNSLQANGESVQFGGNPNLKVETSDAMQAEINARIYKGKHRIRELTFRVDGSYTRMDNFITITQGAYSNTGKRALTSLEFLGKLYIQGGHRVELGYTYLRGDTNDVGRLRALPENTFTLAGVWQLMQNKLSVTGTFRVRGAAEDPNRLVEYRGLRCAPGDGLCQSGSLLPTAPGAAVSSVQVLETDMVYDRIPPVADLTIGLTYMPTAKLSVALTAYNALVSHTYQPDVYFDYTPQLEYLPNPSEGFRAFLSAAYQY